LVDLLRYIQFPWRFLSVSLVMVGLISAYSLRLVPKYIHRVVLGGTLIFIILGNFWYFRAEEYMPHPQALYYDDVAKIQSSMSGILPDFIPLGFGLLDQPPKSIVFCAPICEDDQLETLADKTHQKLIRVNLEVASSITFAVADFPGWQVEIDGERVEKMVDSDGLIVVLVPAGGHLVGLSFESTTVRFWSDLVSIIALIIIVGYFYYQQREKR